MNAISIRMNHATMIFCAALMLGVFTAMSAHAASAESTKEEIKEAASSVKEFSVEQKDAAVAKARELMDSFDDKVHVWQGKIEEKWDDLKDSSRDEYTVAKDAVEKQRQEAAEWLDKLQNSSADAWDETKEGFSEAYDKLNNAWDEARKDMLDKQ